MEILLPIAIAIFAILLLHYLRDRSGIKRKAKVLEWIKEYEEKLIKEGKFDVLEEFHKMNESKEAFQEAVQKAKDLLEQYSSGSEDEDFSSEGRSSDPKAQHATLEKNITTTSSEASYARNIEKDNAQDLMNNLNIDNNASGNFEAGKPDASDGDINLLN